MIDKDNLPNIMKKRDDYVLQYPEAEEFADRQLKLFWTEAEIDIRKDINDILVTESEATKHAVITILKLFVKYERKVGDEYWSGVVKKWFNIACVGRMADAFGFFETNSHAPFYNKINKLLHLNTEEFYNSYIEDPTLKARVDFIDSILAKPNKTMNDRLIALGVFAIIEGAILFSSFAFIKSFQANGNNKYSELVSGIDFSIRDESLHNEGGSWLFLQALHECIALGLVDYDYIVEEIIKAALYLYEHEDRICDMIFEKGNMENIEKDDLKEFVKHRIGFCLKMLQITPPDGFDIKETTVGKWFYKSGKAPKIHDFFNKTGNQYVRNWKEGSFIWGQV